jgi:hypothetical protein
MTYTTTELTLMVVIPLAFVALATFYLVHDIIKKELSDTIKENKDEA